MTIKVHAITLCGLAIPLLAAQAQTAQTPAAPAPTGTEKTIQEIKNPVSWLTWGGDFRVRNEYLDNTVTLNPSDPLHEQDYFRFRARIWASITPVEDFSLNARLATEPREWMRPAGFTPMRGHSGLDWTEGVIDTLNVQWRNILGQPLTATIGRQDIMLGEGWLTGDGSPFDGSWTYFLDAARLTYSLKDLHTTIDAIGLVQYARDDAWLPTINNQNRALTDQNEKGAILYVANKSLPAANVDGYFIYKHDTRLNNNPPAGTRGDNGDIYTVGTRLSGLPMEHLKYSIEGAYQFGEKQDFTLNANNAFLDPSARTTGFRDISAFGVNSKLTYLFKDKLNNQASMSYEFLSGDDPGTGNDEMFDVLWGRYPRWSEIGLYSMANETRIGQQANYHRFGPTWSLTPVKDLDFSASYYAMFADQDVPTRQANAALFTRTGNFRGHFVQAYLKYKFSKHMSGHLWSEFPLPGDYYVNRQPMSFLRAEVLFTF